MRKPKKYLLMAPWCMTELRLKHGLSAILNWDK
jgi:hypothetical protein